MRTRNILAALLLMVAGLQTAWGQGFRVYKSDGTIMQFSLRTDSIVFYDGIGTDVDFGPFTPVNQCIVGTWYKTKSESVTFREDGTTDYMADVTYKFFPYQGNIVFFNASYAPINILKVYEVTAGKMIVSSPDGGNLSVWSSTQPVQLVTGITLNQASLSLVVGKTQTLTATVLPSNATNKAVTWTSSNTSVATVSTSGMVTAKAVGTCTITCAATDGSGVKAECQLTIVLPVTGITISPSTLTLEPGKTQTLTATVLPSNATNKAVAWTSSNTSVATVSTSGMVTAKAVGTCTITCSATDGSGVKATCQVTVGSSGQQDNHEYVNLGLPSGTLWATCNVGASSPEEYGDYFAWGETVPKDEYNQSIYFDTDDGGKTFKKYHNGGGLTELLPEDDAATANWGSGWQMPSLAQIQELYNSSNTTTEWTQVNGVNGRKITSKSNGNSIFLPAAGYRFDTYLSYAGRACWYWSRSLDTSGSSYAYSLYIDDSGLIKWDFIGRDYGHSVRPVRVQEANQ